jgi:hypothetical protein
LHHRPLDPYHHRIAAMGAQVGPHLVERLLHARCQVERVEVVQDQEVRDELVLQE